MTTVLANIKYILSTPIRVPVDFITWFRCRRAKRVISVTTGDVFGAGTDANVYIKLYDENKQESADIHLDNWLRDDFERGNIDDFPCPELDANFKSISKIELWRDNAGFGAAWYVDKIEIIDRTGDQEETLVFPIHRWIRDDRRHFFTHLDCLLPTEDDHIEQRQKELEEKKTVYIPAQHHPLLPVQVKDLPDDETFSDSYKWDIVKSKVQFMVQAKLTMWRNEPWSNLEDLTRVYGGMLPRPYGADNYMSDCDFGRQRTIGANPILIKLCKEIPSNFGVTGDMVKPFLEGKTLQEAIDAKRIFIIDLKILEDVSVKDGLKLCVPIALFYVQDEKDLLPIAIQLFQEKGNDNPVFLPSDPPNTWLIAKMWYNNADAMFHQCVTHLAYTHLLMESTAVCFHRNLSPSHPIFKLLAPHFLFLLAINSRGLKLLIAPGGWVDKTMTVGVDGCVELIGKGINMWRLDVHGTIEKELEARGVLDPDVLPGYYYRDDGIALYKVIKKYVSKTVNHFYDSDRKLIDDYEIQNMVKEWTTPREEGGMGIKGVPGNGRLTNREELIQICACVIFTCSVSHASANFGQYDEYAFPPYYPAFMRGTPPNDKLPRSEQDIVDSLPAKDVTLDSMVVTKLLSMKGTKSLGHFEFKYLYHPVCQNAAQELIEDLEEISISIRKRNTEVGEKRAYALLDPVDVPNSISI